MRKAFLLASVLMMPLLCLGLLGCPPPETEQTYAVIYMPNGATAGTAPAEQIKVHGVALVLASNSGNLARSGYYFSGWNTVVDGTGTNYPEGASYAVNKSATLYANWSLIPSYSVSYNSNGSTAGSLPEPQLKTHGQPLTLASNTGGLEKSGWTFSCWNSLASGEGTDYSEGANYTAESAVILYAKWTRETYIISYDGNGENSGTAPAPQNKIQGISLILATNYGNLTRTGYVFQGWNSKADGSGTVYAEGSAFIENASTLLYAYWGLGYPVTYSGNGNTGGSVPAVQTKIHNVDLTVSANTGGLTRAGYGFYGWCTSSTYNGGTRYSGSGALGVYTGNAPLTLYANWHLDGSGSSCPFVYVGDGKGGFSYLTDLQGPIIGMPEGNLMRSRAGLYTHEHVVLDGQKKDAKGLYRLKLREIQPEISYVDDLKLLFVDLPEGYDIASSSAEQTYGNGYVNPFKYYTLRDPRSSSEALDWKKRNVTVELEKSDGVPAPVTAEDVPSYEFDFGDFDGSNAKLVIYAWTLFDPSYQSAQFIPPSVEIQNEKGVWNKVRNIGLPAGDVKKMVIDLSGASPKQGGRIRLNLGTRSWVRWVLDSVRLDDSAPVVTYQRIVSPKKAMLLERGGGTMSQPSFNARISALNDELKVDPENRGSGNFTRYGSVKDLLAKADDMFAIFTNGDELDLVFKDPPPVEKGYTRIAVLKIHHYFKSFYGDHEVEPLPFKGMSSYPYPETEKYPDTAEHRRYLKKYQTRVLD